MYLENFWASFPGSMATLTANSAARRIKFCVKTVAARYEEQWRRISSLQRDLISQGGLAYVDDLEAAAIKLRQFVDRVRTASYGYAGFFDAIKIQSEELEQLYQYDLWLLSLVDEIGRAIDNVEASLEQMACRPRFVT